MEFQLEAIDKYSDVTIRLININDLSKTLDCRYHRMMLAGKCEFFDRMFDFQPTNNLFEIKINCIEVMKILIDSLYNFKTKVDLPQWQVDLEMIRCRNYLGLHVEPDYLYILDVQDNQVGFELFVEIACLFDITSDIELQMSIKRNIPINYDSSRFTTEMFDLLSQKKPSVIYEDYNMYQDHNVIHAIDLASGFDMCYCKVKEIKSFLVLTNGDIIIVTKGNQISLLKLPFKSLFALQSIPSISTIKIILETTINDQIAIVVANKYDLAVVNLEPNTIQHQRTLTCEIIKIVSWYNSKTKKSNLFIQHPGNIIAQFDSELNFIRNHQLRSSLNKCFFVANNKIFVDDQSKKGLHIVIYDIDNCTEKPRQIKIPIPLLPIRDEVRSKSETKREIKIIIISANGNIAAISVTNMIILMDLAAEIIINKINVRWSVEHLLITPDEKKILYENCSKFCIRDIATTRILSECQVDWVIRDKIALAHH